MEDSQRPVVQSLTDCFAPPRGRRKHSFAVRLGEQSNMGLTGFDVSVCGASVRPELLRLAKRGKQQELPTSSSLSPPDLQVSEETS